MNKCCGFAVEFCNDAAIAIAGISLETFKFCRCDERKAREIGAYNTIFLNPSGLTEDGHLTTANDLAIITRYALKNLPGLEKWLQPTLPSLAG